jgi:hypothetical protein
MLRIAELKIDMYATRDDALRSATNLGVSVLPNDQISSIADG